MYLIILKNSILAIMFSLLLSFKLFKSKDYHSKLNQIASKSKISKDKYSMHKIIRYKYAN
jgi:hypothetical protein